MTNAIRKFSVTHGLTRWTKVRKFKSGRYYYYSGLRTTFERSLSYISGSRALDIGAGYGNETKVLLDRGFSVVAVETEPGALKYLKRIESKNPKLIVSSVSLPNIPNKMTYDIIVCEMVLHFLSKPDVHRSIKNMQHYTVPRGLNVISSYIEQDSIHKDERLVGYFDYLLAADELDELYKDWDILHSELKGNLMGHKSIRFIARRK